MSENNSEGQEVSNRNTPREDKLISWIMAHIHAWDQYKKEFVSTKWSEYWKLWKGEFDETLKSRQSERSKLISPALQQAVDSGVAELEEATFGKGDFFDLSDDFKDQEFKDIENLREQLKEDIENSDIPAQISEVILNAAIFGTGIGKISPESTKELRIEDEVGKGIQVNSKTHFQVKLYPVDPRSFVIDPSAKTIDEALGVGEILEVPKHTVLKKQQEGLYFNKVIGGRTFDSLGQEEDESAGIAINDVEDETTQIIEYHGLVPKSLLVSTNSNEDEFEDVLSDGSTLPDADNEEDELVEALITIANGNVLLKADENPLWKKDRAYIAFPYDVIPNSFWGRGVAEKAYNPQKALDAELRARTDAMAFAVHPMMGVDASALPRGFKFEVAPGKSILTQGNPGQALLPINFNRVDPTTFSQSGDLERMIQMATGSMDSAAPIAQNPRNQTASGMSMIQAGALKRTKRTLRNMERLFTGPLIHKIAWRYMQFDKDRYVPLDVKFQVHTSLGIMARELEQQQLSGLLNTVPPESPAYWMLIRSIYENSSISNKESMIPLIDQLLERTLNPPQPSPTIDEQLKAQEMQLKARDQQVSRQIEFIRANAELIRAELSAEKIASENAKNEADAILALSRAASEQTTSDIKQFQTEFDAILEAQRQNIEQAEPGVDENQPRPQEGVNRGTQ